MVLTPTTPIQSWKTRFESLAREELRKREAFFSLSPSDQEEAFQLVVELQNGDRRVKLADMITAWEWNKGVVL